MADGEQLSDGLAELAGLVVGEQSLQQVLERVAVLSAGAIYGVDGAGVTWLAAGKKATVTASHEFVRRVDQVQYRFDEGPCLQAYDEQEVILAPTLSEDARWPRFTPPAMADGVLGVVSAPLTVRGHALGALNLYSHTPRLFDNGSGAAAALFAEQAARALANAQAFDAAQSTVDQLYEALISRAVIDQAKGIVMGRERCDAERAFELLREASQSTHVKLREVARRLVDSAADTDTDGPGAGTDSAAGGR